MADQLDALVHQMRVIQDRAHELQVALDTAAQLVAAADDQRINVEQYQAGIRRLRAVKADQ